MDKPSDQKIVVIGGGSGIFPVLIGLKQYFQNLTVITTTADDGSSTGLLREEFGILPPGDIRRALVALSKSDNKILSELFNYRFTEGKGLSGHAFGNLLLTALERITGSFERAIEEAGRILSISGTVLPVTTTPTRLIAELENSQIIRGETNIDIPRHDGRLKIQKLWLEPKANINPKAAAAIKAADLVIIGPGDLYTSLIPNLLAEGAAKALKATKAKVLYFVNCMTKFGETTSFSASDFAKTITGYTGEGVIDYIAINKTKPATSRLKAYAAEQSFFVNPDVENFAITPLPVLADLIRSRGFIRHDPEKVAALVKQLI